MNVSPEQEIDLLKQLTQGAGWDHFVRMANEQWSDSMTLKRITEDVGRMPVGDEPSHQESVRGLLLAQKAVMQLVNEPTRRLKELQTKHPEKKDQTPVGRFLSAVGRTPSQS